VGLFFLRRWRDDDDDAAKLNLFSFGGREGGIEGGGSFFFLKNMAFCIHKGIGLVACMHGVSGLELDCCIFVY
jgi:hypothetical protein